MLVSCKGPQGQFQAAAALPGALGGPLMPYDLPFEGTRRAVAGRPGPARLAAVACERPLFGSFTPSAVLPTRTLRKMPLRSKKLFYRYSGIRLSHRARKRFVWATIALESIAIRASLLCRLRPVVSLSAVLCHASHSADDCFRGMLPIRD